eukprot:9178139-Pyramimonas_sp.AAC.1
MAYCVVTSGCNTQVLQPTVVQYMLCRHGSSSPALLVHIVMICDGIHSYAPLSHGMRCDVSVR